MLQDSQILKMCNFNLSTEDSRLCTKEFNSSWMKPGFEMSLIGILVECFFRLATSPLIPWRQRPNRLFQSKLKKGLLTLGLTVNSFYTQVILL